MRTIIKNLVLILCLFATAANADPFGQLLSNNITIPASTSTGGITPPALDAGTPQTGTNNTTAVTTTTTYTASTSGDVLVLALSVGTSSQANTVASVTSSPSLTWTQQATQNIPVGTGARTIYIYTAPTGGSFSGTATITLNTVGGYFNRYLLFGVTNPNATIADPNGANPSENNSGGSSTQAASAVISTTHGNDFLIGEVVSNTAFGTLTRPSGFTQVLSTGTTADVSYEVLSSPLSSVTEAYSWTGAADKNGIALFAIQGQ